MLYARMMDELLVNTPLTTIIENDRTFIVIYTKLCNTVNMFHLLEEMFFLQMLFYILDWIKANILQQNANSISKHCCEP